jgi:hypothetical protein
VPFDPDEGLAGALDIAALLTSDLPRHVQRGAAAMPHLDPRQVTDKLVAETALLLLVASRAPFVAERSGRIVSLAGALTRFARTPRHFALLAGSPQAVLGVGLAHIALTALGFADPLFDEAVAEALNDPAIEAVDRPTFRQLELGWLRGLHAHAEPDFGAHLQASLLRQKLHPAWMRREDAYAATHTAMYLTDFGRLPLPPVIPGDRLAYFTDHALSWCAASRDWDLLAEVLIAGLAARQPAAGHGWALRLLAQRFAEHGAVFGPNVDDLSIPTGREWMRNSELLLHAYHPTFVYGILCALELSASNGQHRPPATAEPGQAAVEGALIMLIREGPWDALLERLTELEPAASGRLAESCREAAAKLMRVIRTKAAEAH